MSVKCHEIISAMEILAPKNLAESWDNVGLMLGSQNDNINKILFALDCSEAVIDEAIEIGANMIITHHPFIFKALKTLDFDTPIGKKIKKAIKNNKKQLTTLQHFAILKLPKRGGQREHFLFMQRRMKLHRD